MTGVQTCALPISLGQQYIGCQGYGHVRSECPTFLKSKGKAIAVTLVMMKNVVMSLKVMKKEFFFFFASIAIVVVGELEIIKENPFDGELFENADL